MDRVSILSKRALVSKLFYAKVPKARLSVWIQDFWKPVLGYCSRVSLVSNHWFIFHFMSEEYLLKILSSPWILNRGFLMLKRWAPSFSPFSESFSKRFMWMLLLDFLIELWSKLVFEDFFFRDAVTTQFGTFQMRKRI